VWGFLSFLIESFLPCECLICKRELRPVEPADIPARRAAWAVDIEAFFAEGPRLRLCGGLSVPARLLCPACWLALEPAGGAQALAGPRPLERPVDIVSPFCENDELLAVVRFLKFSGGRAAAPGLAWWMARALRSYLRSRSGDEAGPVLVPVPLHPRRERSRGYNQALLLAVEVGRLLDVEVDRTLLVRVRHTKSQSTLADGERGANVRGAFALRPGRPSGARDARSIVLVDDLVTTGETALACASALAELHPVSLAVLAAGRRRGLPAGPSWA
jgi:ComF family protein